MLLVKLYLKEFKFGISQWGVTPHLRAEQYVALEKETTDILKTTICSKKEG